MHKRVLLAEASDNIRTVAETLLRQNGFEVVAVASGPKACDISRQARPDLVIVGGELTDEAGQPLYAVLQGAQGLQGVPVLVLNDPGDTSLPLPEEIILPRPFDPRDFIEKVMVFSGRSDSPDQRPSNPLDQADMDDEFLDAALGLDQIDVANGDLSVTDSEVLGGQTTQIPTKSSKKPTKEFVGLDEEPSPDDTNQTGEHRVESIMIHQDKAKHPQPPAEPPKDSQVQRIGTAKIDIVDLAGSDSDAPADHDYNWFINSMQEEVGQLGKDKSADQQPAGSPVTPPDKAQPADDLRPEDIQPNAAAEHVDPVTPPPGSTGTKDKSAGVEKFIDEFKKEIEKFEGDELERVSIDSSDSSDSGQSTAGNAAHKWEDTIENITSEDLQLFTRQFAAELAGQLSDKLADRLMRSLDSDKLLVYLRNEIMARAARK